MLTRWSVKRKPDDGVQCSLCKAPTIYVEPKPRAKIGMLMSEYPSTEWIGYLVGKEHSGNYFVEDLSIPPHEESSGGSCLAEPFHIPKVGCIGVIHSHHRMGAFHSGQDDHTVDRNFEVSITVAKKGTELEWDAISHVTTQCGKHSLLHCPVKDVQPKPEFDRDEFLRDAKANIEKGRKLYSQLNSWTQDKTLQSPFIPIRYRIPGLEDTVVDSSGRVLSKAELDVLRYNIMEGD